MLTKYIGDTGDSVTLGKQHKKISLVWDKNPTYLQGGWFGINAPRGLTAVRPLGALIPNQPPRK